MRLLIHLRPLAANPAPLLAGILLGVILASCGGPTPSPPTHSPHQTLNPSTVSSPVPAIATSLPIPLPSPRPSSIKSDAALSPTAIRIAPTLSPTVLPATASPSPAARQSAPFPTLPLPHPTPHPDNSAWVKKRVDTVAALYRPTPAGIALLHSLDVRQMKGEPGFFGSYGFNGWAGIGEAKPVPATHELMHSYWGGFPVIGQPELSWERQEGQRVAPAMAGYHRDILAFMAQPPDDYEMLRQRLRNLPGVSGENTEPLFHSLEADIPYATGGDLGLVPPILRKYWGYFLNYGPFYTWERAAGWFQSLSHEQRVVADKFLGFQHLDLRKYANNLTYATPDALLPAAAPELAGEERQRLTDLATQFDLLLGDAQLEENFQFWRGYLQDKLALHRAHPRHLGSLDSPRAGEIADALEFLMGLGGIPANRASSLADRIPVQPFLVNFLPAVDNPTLVALFANDPNLPDGPTLQATASFVERLQRFGAIADRILDAGRVSPEEGARALENFLAATGHGNEQDLRLFFDLFHDAAPPVAHRIMLEVKREAVRALMPTVPVQLRTLLTPVQLLDKLDITAESSDTDLSRGIKLLLEETSGNYRIDEPFLERLYEVMAELSPGEALRVFSETPFPLEGMILSQPAAATAALSSDIVTAVALVENSDAVVSPPARIIYRLIMADPNLAAKLVIALENHGQHGMAAESLAHFAYDKARTETYPQLPISLSQDGAFLNSLLERQGAEWLQAQLTEAVSLYRAKTTNGEVAPDFLTRYRETLEAAAHTLDPDDRGRLMEIIRAVFA